MFLPQRFFHPHSATAHAPVAISACLTGEPVRYDGNHKRLPQWQPELAAALSWLPVCPELGAGLGVPRPPVQLVATAGQSPRALGRDDRGLDVTAVLADFAAGSVAMLRERQVCGYLWQSRSPSCGSGSTPLFDEARQPIGLTSGIQAARIRRELPWLVVAEDTAVATLDAARLFVLRCRLAFDVLRTTAAMLPDLHRHYAALAEGALAEWWNDEVADALQSAAAAGETTGYLTVFNAANETPAAGRLLALFSR